jgi:hypothetical protein
LHRHPSDVAVGVGASLNFPWSKATRVVVSIALFSYMTLVILGPLSNPIASEHLTAPLGRWVAPIHHALFLGHGYRFFGPDPGPSHSLLFKVTGQNGEVVEGRIPERQRHWPRLLYHRWFMLSESTFEELAFTPDEESHRRNLADLDKQIDESRKRGELASLEKLKMERRRQQISYPLTRQRIDQLLMAISRHLLDRYDGQSVELSVQERLIALPEDVRSGVQLADPRYLTQPQKIASYTRDELSASAAGDAADGTRRSASGN